MKVETKKKNHWEDFAVAQKRKDVGLYSGGKGGDRGNRLFEKHFAIQLSGMADKKKGIGE